MDIPLQLSLLPPPSASQNQEDKDLNERYFQEVIQAPEKQKLQYFAGIQKQLELALRRKFGKLGYKMIRIPKLPGVYYKIASKKDAFEFNVINRLLVLNALLNDACFSAPPQARINLDAISNIQFFPDVKMLKPDYRAKKINKIAEVAVKKFIPMEKLI